MGLQDTLGIAGFFIALILLLKEIVLLIFFSKPALKLKLNYQVHHGAGEIGTKLKKR